MNDQINIIYFTAFSLFSVIRITCYWCCNLSVLDWTLTWMIWWTKD